MHHRQIASLVTQVFATAERLGSTVPKPLVAEHKKLTRLAEATRLLDLPADVPGAVLAALEAGNDPATDQSVRDAVVAREINATANGIEARLAERAGRFLTDNVDDLLSMFAGPFDKAAAIVTDAASRLGDVDLDDTQAVLSRGGDAAQVWAAAQDAEQVITSIVQVWKQVASQVPGMSLDPRYRLLLIADINPADYLDQQLNHRSARLRPFELARRGHRLSLATPATFAARDEAVRTEITERSDHAAGAFTREYRRKHRSLL